MGFPFQGTSMPITPESLDEFDDDKVASLAQRLEDDDYPTPFDGLNAVSYTHLTLPTILRV